MMILNFPLASSDRLRERIFNKGGTETGMKDKHKEVIVVPGSETTFIPLFGITKLILSPSVTIPR